MKKLLPFSIGLNLILFSLFIYQNQTSSKSCCEYEGNTMTIGAKDVLKMIRSYRNERQQIINHAANGTTTSSNLDLSSYKRNSETDFVDSRAITFPIDSIKKYICSIERTIESNPNLNDYQLSGLRFYYIVYDGSAEYVQNEIVPHNPDYENCHSLLIVPTVYDADRKAHIDFEPNIFANKKGLDQNLIKENTQLQFFHLKTDVSSGEALSLQNKGSICPPPKPCDGYDLLNLADELCPSPDVNSSCPN